MTGADFLAFAGNASLALIGLAMLATLVRLVLGPTLPDRILALDTITVLAAAAIAVFAIRTGLYFYVDIAVALCLVGVLSTAAFARYLISRGMKAQPE